MTQIESSNLGTQVGVIGIFTHLIIQKTTSLPLDVDDDFDKFPIKYSSIKQGEGPNIFRLENLKS